MVEPLAASSSSYLWEVRDFGPFFFQFWALCFFKFGPFVLSIAGPFVFCLVFGFGFLGVGWWCSMSYVLAWFIGFGLWFLNLVACTWFLVFGFCVVFGGVGFLVGWCASLMLSPFFSNFGPFVFSSLGPFFCQLRALFCSVRFLVLDFLVFVGGVQCRMCWLGLEVLVCIRKFLYEMSYGHHGIYGPVYGHGQ